MPLVLVIVPLCLAALAFALTSDRARPFVVTLGALVQCALVGAALTLPDTAALGGWLQLDALGKLVVGLTTLLFAACAVYLPGFLHHHRAQSNRLFCGSMLAFLAALTLVAEAHHLGILWVAIEANTLAAAPLLYFTRGPRALEAMWKYLLMGSVGIALALLGSFLLAYAALHGGERPSLALADLVQQAPRLSRPWLHAALIVLLVGYGTKMGIAPLHTWKPDAYGEAPGITGALLAGGLTTGAFLAILRVHRIAAAAGDVEFMRRPMIVLGLLSMLVAGVFMAGQRDIKRLLAYSSVEHMGILILGIGIGGAGVFGALLHLLNNALVKGVLFLAVGNLHRVHGSKSSDEVRGALRTAPVSAALLLAGFFAVTGSPPFGLFPSELMIVTAAFTTGQPWVGGAFIVLIAIVFVGMAGTVVTVVQGEPASGPTAAPSREDWRTVAPSLVLLGLVLVLGVTLPAPVAALLEAAARAVAGP